MPTVLLFTIVTFILGSSAWADQDRPSLSHESPQSSCENRLATADQSADERIRELGRRGCCSWHGGVCGCGGPRLLCCDGSLSPSCPCAQPDAQGDSHTTPVRAPQPLRLQGNG